MAVRSGVRRAAWVAGAAGVLAALVAASLLLGSRHLAPADVWHALWPGSAGGSEATLVVRSLRVPRTVIGLLAGCATGMAGVLMQALTRNPIADPGLLGVNAGAALGIVTAISVFGIGSVTGYIWFGFAGAGLAALAGFVLASRGRAGATPVTLALAGAALASFLGAVTTAVLVLDANTFDQFRFWLVGSLTGRGLDVAVSVLPFLAAGAVLALVVARGLDALVLGEDVAVGLGHRVGRVRAVTAAAVTLLTGGAVAAAGPIGFVGLTVPHLARAMVGSAHRWVLVLSALLGAGLLLLADVVGRLVAGSGELQAGVVTALLGAPVLVAVVRRRTVVAA
jgi:iron complex transport system permease protein